MLSNEQPIKSSEDDFLNRKYFADHVSSAIINYEDKKNDSLTIGLYGKWGSGKTSIINMVTENLQDKENIIVFNFEPWLFSDTHQLISGFFKEFSKKVGNSDKSEELKKISEKLEAYASFFDVLSLVPEPTTFTLSKLASKVFSLVGKSSQKFSEAYKKDLAGTKEDIENHLRKLDKKILIIIDDIDRLNNSEIKQVFQLIKALGNFPNTIYVSSMDKEVVVNALKDVQKGDGNEYLEKIINVPIEVPQMSEEDIHKFLFRKLDEIIKEVDESDFDQKYWSNIFHSGYKNFFTNIRDVIRYINILRFNYNALQNEVNVIDLMVITAFQVFEPKIYEFMKTNKDLFSGQESDGSYGNKKENNEYLMQELDNCKKILQKLDEESFSNLLQEVFLKVKEAYSNAHYTGELSRLRKLSKVSSPDFFDAYFTLKLTEELSNQKMKQIINKTSNEEEFSNVISGLIEDKKISKFLNRIQDYTREDIAEENFQIVFNVLMNLGDRIPEDKQGMFSLGNNIELMRIFYQLCMRLDDKSKRYQLYKKAIEKSKDSIYTACHEVSVLMQRNGEYDEKDTKEEKVINSDDLQDLKNILLVKINDWVKDKLLFDHEHALSIMYLWKKLDEQGSLKYIKTNINSQDKLLKFLQTFIHFSYSQNVGDYTLRKTRNFHYKAIQDFIDVETIFSDIKNIDKELDEIEKFCVDSFIANYENKIQEDNF